MGSLVYIVLTILRLIFLVVIKMLSLLINIIFAVGVWFFKFILWLSMNVIYSIKNRKPTDQYNIA